MGLSFAESAAPGPLPETPEGTWATWAAGQRPPAPFLAAWSGRAVHGFDGPLRLGGVVVQPARVVLGIRAWDDAFEGTLAVDGETVPWALFEVEKIVRMMLHQSGLAFEILASPAALHDDEFPARRIVDAAVTRDILHHYRDVASGWMARLVEAKGQGATPADVLDVVRHALTGRALADGRTMFDLWALVDEYGVDGLDGLLHDVEKGVDPALLDEVASHVEELLKDVQPDEAKLPERPEDYDWLNDVVVEWRMRHEK